MGISFQLHTCKHPLNVAHQLVVLQLWVNNLLLDVHDEFILLNTESIGDLLSQISQRLEVAQVNNFNSVICIILVH